MTGHEGTSPPHEEQGDEGERPRPRVVDKRVSSASPTSQPERTEPASSVSEPLPTPDTAAEAAEPEAAPQAQVWTPEQEEQARKIAEEIVATPSIDWVVNTAVTLANVSATKLELGDPNDAALAIDALAALVNGLDAKLGETLGPLRSTLAQLQMTFARIVASPQKPDA